ncbi:hypothetical protein [Companilactobacillus sp.]|uniref:DUF7336 domain-containing protein n=1 Tax=Companilactobacillus sp. TaxID=2767905 RepID=UPI0026043F6C|nr:hypothetical protein [Companilactobacillus sp.]
MKLYVVDRDDSGCDMVDYGIVGIFSTKEKAVDFMRKIDDPKNKYLYEITETNLDNPGKEMSDLSVFMVD